MVRLPQGVKEIAGCNARNVQYPHMELAEKVIGCAIKVHKILGSGFVEDIYRRALCIELKRNGVAHESEKSLPVLYEGLPVGQHRADLLIENVLTVELKAVSGLTDQHAGQLMSTMLAAKTKIGLLMNFGEARLVDGLRRIII